MRAAVAVLTLALLAIALPLALGSESGRTVTKTTYETKYERINGKLEPRQVPVTRHYKVVTEKRTVPDPADPLKTISFDVTKQEEFVPHAAAHAKISKLRQRLSKLRRREKKIKAALDQAHSSKVDHPVLEDGAPAKPDPQMQKYFDEIVGEIEAVHFPKAPNIRQIDIQTARDMANAMGDKRQALWNWFDDLTETPLVPKHAWESY